MPSLTVAVCDDHRLFGESLAVLLRSVGCTVVAVTSSPEEMLAVLWRDAVDVCVLDLNFGGNGDAVMRTDAIRAISAVSPGSRVVVLTGDRQPDTRPSTLRAGAAAFVRKTDAVETIVAAVRNAHLGQPMPAATPEPGLRPRPGHPTKAHLLARSLTARELQVLIGLVAGEDTRTLARHMGISYSTARSHVQNVLMKLDAHSQLEAAVIAVRYGLVDPDVRPSRGPASVDPAGTNPASTGAGITAEGGFRVRRTAGR